MTSLIIRKLNFSAQSSILFLSMAIFLLFGHRAQADDLDDFIKAQMIDRKIPGLQLAVIKDNEIVKTASYGIANLQDNVPVTDNTVFTINSITKAFVGIAVMQLVEQGKIDLDAHPLDYISDIPEAWNIVTIRQLLTHTSGLPDIMSNDAKLISDQGDAAAWDLVKQLPMDFKPNTQFRYNQTNYLLLGKIIEQVSGETFEDFIRKYQLAKVGMPRTIESGFAHMEMVIPAQARGYTYYKTGNLTNVYEEFPPYLRTAAGMSSNAAEMANWLMALQSGQLLESKSLITLWTPAILDNGKTGGFNRFLNGYALGWPVVRRAEHPAVAPAGGDRAFVIIYPKDNLSVVILTNLMGAGPDQFADEVAGYFLPALSINNGFGLSKELNSFRIKLENEGYDQAVSLAQNMNNISFVESEINNWGYRLLNNLRKEDALEIFKLNVFLFPDHANTYDSLADAYSRLGQIDDAKLNYNKVLEIDPKNRNAQFQLNRLQ